MLSKLLKILLHKLRNLVIGDFRSKKLSAIIVEKIIKYNKKKKIKILDYGSGYQPKVIYFVNESLMQLYKKKISIDCYDFYSKKDLKKLNNNKKNNIAFHSINSIKKNKKKYDFCLINDVIHHIGIEKEKLIIGILNNLADVSKIVFIKDHFQQGAVSNTIIRIIDFLGNYFNDVKVPKNYYSIKTFEKFIKKTNSKIIERVIGIKLYPSFLLFMSNPKFNFIYLIKKFRIK